MLNNNKIIIFVLTLLIAPNLLIAEDVGKELFGPAALQSLTKSIAQSREAQKKAAAEKATKNLSAETKKNNLSAEDARQNDLIRESLVAEQKQKQFFTQREKKQRQIDEQFDPKGLFGHASKIEQQAFSNITRNAMPLTPEQIIRLKEMLSITQRASSASAETPPKPVLSTQVVSLSPGSVPPVIRLQQGFVTTIVFVDNTGADWPIQAYNLGNSSAFNIRAIPGSNVIMLQSLLMYTYGNLAIQLKGLATPIMLTLVPGQRAVDYRIDLHIQHPGPNAKPMIASQMPRDANNILLGILAGVAPSGAVPLIVSDNRCTAWAYNDKMYLRTSLTVLSPSWIGMMPSSDGTNAYEMQQSSDVLVSKDGKPFLLKIDFP